MYILEPFFGFWFSSFAFTDASTIMLIVYSPEYFLLFFV